MNRFRQRLELRVRWRRLGESKIPPVIPAVHAVNEKHVATKVKVVCGDADKRVAGTVNALRWGRGAGGVHARDAPHRLRTRPGACHDGGRCRKSDARMALLLLGHLLLALAFPISRVVPEAV